MWIVIATTDRCVRIAYADVDQ
ncbi:hypothetical protein CNECB9_2900008 [Cupriavidus necator]|uniref:Uncharacterized protein n=1 Tax=Cupriavidus necator TaxID=106590 RepID=A0A1K0IH26_CUPNE|nr:hypothetical protein CNECB9_2900008 [Cupriavidus necator]